ncbi:MAG TPA: alpha/beta fold hydrolase [Solirubrobacteraceae bacterium]|nr:alpha/beta fold hydrolase [Solirubrobacteraceae bacterium]
MRRSTGARVVLRRSSDTWQGRPPVTGASSVRGAEAGHSTALTHEAGSSQDHAVAKGVAHIGSVSSPAQRTDRAPQRAFHRAGLTGRHAARRLKAVGASALSSGVSAWGTVRTRCPLKVPFEVEWQLRHRARTRRGEIAWDAFGEGPPVVLTHGTPSRSLVWREVASALAERHEVYVWDLLGFGDSERHVDQDVSLVAHGEVLAELVEQWGLERPALVGHDIGGAVVLRAHLLEQVPVARLGLVDAVVLAPWITPRTRDMQRTADRWTALPDPELGELIAGHLRTATVAPLPREVFGALFGQWEGREGQALYLRNLAMA